jgi:hypothetical protein
VGFRVDPVRSPVALEPLKFDRREDPSRLFTGLPDLDVDPSTREQQRRTQTRNARTGDEHRIGMFV